MLWHQEDHLLRSGESLTPKELNYYKKILLSTGNAYFSWKIFADILNNDITKQGALKALNQLEDLGLLNSKINTRREKVFKVREE